MEVLRPSAKGGSGADGPDADKGNKKMAQEAPVKKGKAVRQ
jgi:hypothetical protein